MAVARREAHLFQKVLADVFNYDQSDISRIEGGTRLTDAVELENFAVWYQKPLNFFQLGRPGLAKQAGKLEAVLTEDELRVRAVEAKVRRGRRKEEEDGHGYRSRTTRLKAVIRPARFYDPLIFGHFGWPRHVCAFKAIAAAFYLHCGVYYYNDGLVLTAANN